MDPAVLHAMGLRVTRATLTATVRQAAESGILYNATWIRRAMRQNPLPEPVIRVTPFPDIDVLDGEQLADSIEQAYARGGILSTILITRSNQRAAEFNQAVRTMILGAEEELASGEGAAEYRKTTTSGRDRQKESTFWPTATWQW